MGIFFGNISGEISENDRAALFGFSEVLCTIIFADSNILSQTGSLFDSGQRHIIFLAEGFDQLLVIVFLIK